MGPQGPGWPRIRPLGRLLLVVAGWLCHPQNGCGARPAAGLRRCLNPTRSPIGPERGASREQPASNVAWVGLEVLESDASPVGKRRDRIPSFGPGPFRTITGLDRALDSRGGSRRPNGSPATHLHSLRFGHPTVAPVGWEKRRLINDDPHQAVVETPLRGGVTEPESAPSPQNGRELELDVAGEQAPGRAE